MALKTWPTPTPKPKPKPCSGLRRSNPRIQFSKLRAIETHLPPLRQIRPTDCMSACGLSYQKAAHCRPRMIRLTGFKQIVAKQRPAAKAAS
jgi:hypothetical protein